MPKNSSVRGKSRGTDEILQALSSVENHLSLESYCLVSCSEKMLGQKDMDAQEALSIVKQYKRKGKIGKLWAIIPCRHQNDTLAYLVYKEARAKANTKGKALVGDYLGLSLHLMHSIDQYSEMRMLYEILLALSSMHKVKEGTEVAVHIMESIFRTSYVAFGYLNKEADASFPLRGSEPKKKQESGMQKPALVGGKKALQLVRKFHLKGWEKCAHLFAQSLTFDSYHWGWLFVGREKEPFSKGEKELLLTLATLFSSALERLELHERLSEESIRDGLTLLYNHRFLQERLGQEVARLKRYGGLFSVAMIDLDHFKKINDSYGHYVGDQVLRRIGAMFRDQFREVDVIARYGGEEFMLILPQTPLLGAYTACERFRERVEREPFRRGQRKDLRVTISCGICMAPQHGKDKDRLIQKADKAMYRAKKEGRNQTCIAS